ncbi:MAG: pre-peptidase C-terminal domain-containing protein, partial [Alphaproteobacteria bacterium]
MADDFRSDNFSFGELSPEVAFGDPSRFAGAVLGTIEEAGDVDRFKVILEAGTTYTFDLLGSANGFGTLADPFLRLRDAAGTQLNSDDDSGVGLNASFTYTPTVTTVYYLNVSGVGSGTGSFQLQTEGVIQTNHRYGTAGADNISGTYKVAYGGRGNDTITASTGDSFISGGDGNDLVLDAAGFDRVIGGFGNDTLSGNDLTGGQGIDRFKGWAQIIRDAEVETDLIDLTGIGAFQYLDEGAFTSTTVHQIRWQWIGENDYLAIISNQLGELKVLSDSDRQLFLSQESPGVYSVTAGAGHAGSAGGGGDGDGGG